MLASCAVQLVLEGDEGEERALPREHDLPNFKISILLYIFKTINVIFSAGVSLAQNSLPLTPAFLNALLFIF